MIWKTKLLNRNEYDDGGTTYANEKHKINFKKSGTADEKYTSLHYHGSEK